ncbi:hypothetical protein [Mesorhizobium sp. CN2-181]|uniref:hypothetical protein n=1 Tax=Mesorhizobium yinganensis TaxID=3157707 RepID=UPI0032B7E31D
MSFTGVAKPEDLQWLDHIFQTVCERHAITAELDREQISELIIGAYTSGFATHDELLSAVERMIESAFRKQVSDGRTSSCN